MNGTDPSLLSLIGGLPSRTVSTRKRASFLFLLENITSNSMKGYLDDYLTLLRTVTPEVSGALNSSTFMKILKD